MDAAIARSGACAARVFELAGVDPRRVADPSLRLGLIDYCRLFETAAEATGDGLFGARFGSRFVPSNFGAVGALFLNSPTLLDGLRALSRYYGWIQQNSTLGLRLERGVASLDYQVHDGRIPGRRQDAELTLAALCGLIRHCVGRDWRPLETHLEHGPGAATRAYRAVFGADPCFDQITNSIAIDARLLGRPMQHPDARLFAKAHALVRGELTSGAPAPADGDAGLLAMVRFSIEAACREGAVGIEGVARRVGLSVHALRRILRARDLPFDELVSAVRRDVALRYVEESGRPLTDIALLLGYSELSAFSRAFRRWMGVGPMEYRRNHRA